MNYKYAIFSDIDGTIYDHNKIVNQQIYEQVKIAQSKNVPFIIATGNGLFRQVHKLAKEFNCRYAIVSNGSGVFDFQKNKYVFEKRIPHDELKLLLELGAKYEVSYQYWDEDRVWYSPMVEEETKILIKHIMGANMSECAGKIEKEAFKFEFYDRKHKTEIDKIENELKSLGFEYARMKSTHIEVTASGVSKALGTKWVCDKLNINQNNVMAIGDSANDLKMLEFVGYSYSMDNGADIVKKTAKYHASDVNQEGLFRAIEDYLYRVKI